MKNKVIFSYRTKSKHIIHFIRIKTYLSYYAITFFLNLIDSPYNKFNLFITERIH